MKTVKRITLALLAFCLFIFWVFPQPFHIAYANLIGRFINIKQGLYTSAVLSEHEIREIKQMKKSAEQRITEFWGNKKGNAQVYYCADEELYERLCQSPNGSGCSVITPFGAWIILSPTGKSTDVMAHEMCHDELATRIGWWKSRTNIPKWMDEGLALQLDYRFVSEIDSIQRYIDYKSECQQVSMAVGIILKPEELRTEKQFFGNNATYTRLAYLTAATEVSRIISLKGRKEIFRILEEL